MNIKNYKCIGCGSKNIKVVVNFGEFPIATTYSNYADEKVKKNKLGLSICRNCNLIQNSDPVNPIDVYNNSYDYITGVSSAHKKYLKSRANDYIKNFNLDVNSNVLEVASNDGSFQDIMRENGIKLVGIEPSEVPANMAIEKGHDVVIDFFNSNLVKKLNLSKMFDIVIMNNVITHTDNPVDMLSSAKECLFDNGMIVLECMYLGDQLDNNSFETIYHGNYTYLSLSSILTFSNMAGIKVVGAEKINSHGSSIRVWMKKNNTIKNSNFPQLQLLKIQEEEENLGYGHLPTLLEKINDLELVISKFICNFKKFIKQENDFGRIVVGYGAAAKTATYISILGKDSQGIKFVCDMNKNKWGKYFPGTNIEILDPSVLRNADYTIIVFPWNLLPEIKKQLKVENLTGRVISIKEIIEGV